MTAWIGRLAFEQKDPAVDTQSIHSRICYFSVSLLFRTREL